MFNVDNVQRVSMVDCIVNGYETVHPSVRQIVNKANGNNANNHDIYRLGKCNASLSLIH